MYALWNASVDWFRERADGVYARFWLAALSFTEASVFFVPPDPLLAAIVLVREKQWVWYAAFTTFFSIIGAAFGYFVGAALFYTVGVPIIDFYGLAGWMGKAGMVIIESGFFGGCGRESFARGSRQHRRRCR